MDSDAQLVESAPPITAKLGLIRDLRPGIAGQVSVQQAMSAALEELLKQWESPTEE
jgi:hypothetical protein